MISPLNLTLAMEIHTYESSPGAAKIMGIIGFVISIPSFLFSFIPCFGYQALVPGLLGLVICGISYYIEKQKEKPSALGLMLAGMIISVLTIGVATTQYFTFKESIDAVNELNERGDEIIWEMLEEAERRAEEARQDSIRAAQDSPRQ